MRDIKPETVCHVIVAARQFSGDEDVFADEEEAEGSVDRLIEDVEMGRVVHDEHEHDPAFLELRSFIDELAPEEQCELIALAWLGRGDGTKANFAELVELAEERRTKHTGQYLLSMPLLADHLADALEEFGVTCEDFESGHG